GLSRQMRCTFEEERHRYLQNLRNVLQPAGTHAVGALLVFLHLLEREAERGGELRLAHAEHQATHADAAAHVLVDGTCYRPHYRLPCPVEARAVVSGIPIAQ